MFFAWERAMKEKKNQIKFKKISIIIIALLLITISLGACSQDRKSNRNDQADEAKFFVYYVDKNETKVVAEPYQPVSEKKQDLVNELFNALSKEPKDIALKSAKPEKLKVNAFTFNESNNGLSIDFKSEYNTLTGISEVLFRACVVKTLCQIDGIDDVEFYVEGQPLKGINDQPVSFMKEDDFIDDINAENIYVTVYFANEKGNKLIPTNLRIPMKDGNKTIEQLIIKSLLDGPENVKNIENIKDKVQKTVPDGTKLINVSTVDGICYVDFNEKFLDKIKGVKDEVIIYSVVNSLVELSTINKVQFTINGEAKKNYREIDNFDQMFERNLEVIEGSK